MDASINDIILKMEQLLYEKKDALTSIYNLTVKQKEDIEINAGENLEGFIDGKQEQIDKIESIDNLFNNVFQILKKELKVDTLDAIDWKLYPKIKVIKNQVSDIVELTKKTMDLEEENKGNINKIISEVKNDLKRANLGQKSISAYDKPNINIDGVYIDKKK